LLGSGSRLSWIVARDKGRFQHEGCFYQRLMSK
jgi:hypothetical protein